MQTALRTGVHSPDLTPIENAISELKARLRKVAARTVDPLGRAVADALPLVSPSDSAGFFRHCGYPATCNREPL